MENSQLKAKLIDILKALRIFPESGFGEIVITFTDGKIVNVKKVESVKLEEKE